MGRGGPPKGMKVGRRSPGMTFDGAVGGLVKSLTSRDRQGAVGGPAAKPAPSVLPILKVSLDLSTTIGFKLRLELCR